MAAPNQFIPDVSAFILAGGRSRRMGRDKAFLPVAGVPMIERIVSTAQKIVSPVTILSNVPEAFAALDVPVMPDLRPGFGPLGGIETALTKSETGHVLILACDLPFLNVEFLSLLVALRGTADLVVPVASGRPQGLCAVYARSLLPDVTRLLDADRLRVDGLFEERAVRWVNFIDYGHLPGADQLLVNVNSPEDCRRAGIEV